MKTSLRFPLLCGFKLVANRTHAEEREPGDRCRRSSVPENDGRLQTPDGKNASIAGRSFVRHRVATLWRIIDCSENKQSLHSPQRLQSANGPLLNSASSNGVSDYARRYKVFRRNSRSRLSKGVSRFFMLLYPNKSATMATQR
jgi:hypothetical protein